MSGPPRLLWGIALLLVAATGCGISPEAQARALDPSAGPYRVVTRDRVAPPPGSQRIVLYLVRDGALVPVPRRVLLEPTPSNVLSTLSAGPSLADRDDGLTSGLPPDADATVAAVDASTVAVALPTPSNGSTRSDSVLAFGQIVLTLTALPSVSSVVFTQDGQPLQVPRSDGSLSTAPLTRLDYRDLVDPS